MWSTILMYVVAPLIVGIAILRLDFVQKLLEPVRNKLYTRRHQKRMHNGHSHNGHSHEHGDGTAKKNHRGMEKAKVILFKDLINTTSKVKELKEQGVIRILEIGVGTGVNFKYYPEKSHYIGVDPNPEFKKDVMNNLKQFPGIQLENFLHSRGEDLNGVEDSSVDVVVTTAVLCSVKDLQKTFKEIRRVLVPDGKYYYMEHIADEINTTTYWMQKITTILYNLTSYIGITHAGHMDRKIDQEVLKAGFSRVNQQIIRLEFNDLKRNLAGRNALGVATK